MRYRLKQARINAGYTQEQIAVRIGVSQQTVSKYEKAVITPAQFSTLRAYEELFSVAAEELFPDVFLQN